MTFPDTGQAIDQVLTRLRSYAETDTPWHAKKMFIGGSYFGGDEILNASNMAAGVYQNHNALYAGRIFPGLVEIEQEIISMLLNLYNAPPSAIGSLTGGGTESLLLAVMSALNRAKSMGKQGPFDVIIPESAHPGFDKAAHLMGLNAIRLTSSDAYRADIEQIKASIGPNAIFLAASAPSFPFGITDPVDELAIIAKKHRLWLHVDACHGGFVLPFANQLGYAIPDFDFSVDGVTSLSVDLHKLGYANKGASALLLADVKNEKYQRYTFDNWPGGRYSTMGLMGSRSAGGMASAWAMMQILGQTGYREIVSEILTARDRLINGLTDIQGIRVLGNPDAYLIAFSSDTADIMALSEGMLSKGWLTGHLTRPKAIHLFLDRENVTSISEFLEDLSDTIVEVSMGRWSATSVDADYSR